MVALGFNEADTIKSVNDYNYKDKQDHSFDISYGIDRHFLFGCGVSVASLLLNNPDVSFTFHIFTDYFTQYEREKFEKLAQQYKTQIIIYVIDCEKLKTFPTTKNWSYATYFRFIIADHFAGKLDRILYLDADIFCKGSIKELVDLTFAAGEVAAVVLENEKEWWENRAKKLSTPDLATGYFNAGFLLINLKLWAANAISAEAMRLLADPAVAEIITHLDQDILNILLVNQVRFLDKKYNTRLSINYELKKDLVSPINAKTVLIHYVGPTKPWHNWSDYAVSQSFIAAKDASPWKEDNLLSPTNSNQSRYCAKHNFNQKKYLSWIKNYICYYKFKLAEK